MTHANPDARCLAKPSSQRWCTMACLLALACACSPDASVGSNGPADVAGTYSVSIYYGKNGCDIANWPEGNTLANVEISVEQEGATLVATVGGLPGGVLGLIHGSNVYEGTITGSEAELAIYGTIPQVEGNCTFSFNNYLELSFSGDYMRGDIRFEPASSDNPDCRAVRCVTEMTVNGTRPPKP